MRKRFLSVLLALGAMISMMAVSASAGEFDTNSVEYDGISIPVNSEYEPYQFVDEDEIRYWAYMDIERTEENLKSIVLQARNILIHRESWVADGVYGCILDKNGNLKKELPQFHELFPADWDEPMSEVVVDLSYYMPPREKE